MFVISKTYDVQTLNCAIISSNVVNV